MVSRCYFYSDTMCRLNLALVLGLVELGKICYDVSIRDRKGYGSAVVERCAFERWRTWNSA